LSLKDLAGRTPTNWGRFGSRDEIGTLNFLTPMLVAKAANSVKYGELVTLGLEIGSAAGDPLFPMRTKTIHFMTVDEAMYRNGAAKELAGGLQYTDDAVVMALQGTTHIDALGHIMYAGKIYNGYPAETTNGGLKKDDVSRLAEKGLAGRGILLDVPAYKRKNRLRKGETITCEDLQNTASYQNLEIRKHDILLVRTGYLNTFFEKGAASYFTDRDEPGITYSPEMVRFFVDNEFVAYGADTVASEQTKSATLKGIRVPMHYCLLYQLGIPIMELLWLENLSVICKRLNKYDFFFVCSPLKFVGATGSPINPIAIV